VALAELAVTEIDARHLVALRAVAENAVGPEQPLAFQDVRGRIVTLAQQRPGRKGKKRKPNRPHTRSPFRWAYIIAPWRLGQQLSPDQLLPDQLQRELNFPGGGLRRRDQPGAGSPVPRLVEDGPIIVGRGEVGAVEDIEKLCPKLDVEIFRDS